MKLFDFIKSLAKTPQKIKRGVERVTHAESDNLKMRLMVHSPLDISKTADDVVFRDNWKVVKGRFSAADTLVAVKIRNDGIPYASLMEEGAGVNQAPWYFPKGKPGKKTGRTRKITGKLKVAKGRVWAGGHAPGHSQTVGGVITNALKDVKGFDKLQKDIADATIEAWG